MVIYLGIHHSALFIWHKLASERAVEEAREEETSRSFHTFAIWRRCKKNINYIFSSPPLAFNRLFSSSLHRSKKRLLYFSRFESKGDTETYLLSRGGGEYFIQVGETFAPQSQIGLLRSRSLQKHFGLVEFA